MTDEHIIKDLVEDIDDALDSSRAFSKWPFALALIFTVLLGFGFGSLHVWAQQYDGTIGPNVYAGGVDISGADRDTARQRLQKRIDEILTEGLRIRLGEEVRDLPLVTLVTTDLIEDVSFDIEQTLDEAFSASRSDNLLRDRGQLLLATQTRTELPVATKLVEENILSSVHAIFPDRETQVQNAGFEVTFVGGEPNITITAEIAGHAFDTDLFFENLEQQMNTLEQGEVELTMSVVDPTITKDDAEGAINRLLAVLERGPYSITHEDMRGFVKRWSLDGSELAEILEPSLEDFPLALNDVGFNTFLDTIAETVEQPAEDARFEIKNGWVSEFQESEAGIAIDREAMKEAFHALLESTEENEVMLITEETEPEVATGDANDLGITEILGVGTSSYAGSPSNRVKNIANGVRLLNGRLIAPGETFSLTNALKPFTFENGYLPELVIKGDRIEPELGGGLCQIGTTTFRATMNSGLPVTERRNHSLVVNYYNDPSNGNPGTDATIYEPAPDYKFTNDTENYVLFQAEMLYNTADLRFTFWGTSDGRKGSYTPPVVHRWIGVGETKYIETTDLAPGIEQCQGAHTGADASFTYTIERPDGTVEEELYSSHYRPLPRICLIGVQEEKEEEGFAELPPGIQTKNE